MTLREAARRIGALEDLVKYLFDELDTVPWTVTDAIEIAAENGLVYRALVECIGKDFTVVRVSRFLTRIAACGANISCAVLNGIPETGPYFV